MRARGTEDRDFGSKAEALEYETRSQRIKWSLKCGAVNAFVMITRKLFQLGLMANWLSEGRMLWERSVNGRIDLLLVLEMEFRVLREVFGDFHEIFLELKLQISKKSFEFHRNLHRLD